MHWVKVHGPQPNIAGSDNRQAGVVKEHLISNFAEIQAES